MKKLLFSSLLLGASLFAAEPLKSETISLAQAQKAINTCIDLAKKNNWAMSISVVDRGTNLKAQARMDGALAPADIGSKAKAITSLSWWAPTHKVAEIVKNEPNFKLFPGILPIGGGYPIFSKSGNIIGAVGVAGSMVKNDMACAKAAAESLSK